MTAKKQHDFFVYKSHPFRPLYLGGVFHEPRDRKHRDHFWLIRDRNVARRLAMLNNCEYADFRDYIRLATGGKRSDLSGERSEKSPRRPHRTTTPTLEDLS